MSEAENKIFPKPHAIEFEFFSKRSNKTTKLINNNDTANSIAGKSKWFSFSFEEPMYLTSIDIDCENYDSWNRFELEIQHSDGTKHRETISITNNKISLKLGKLSDGFSFKPDSKLFANPLINRVIATGYSLSEFHEFEWALKDYEKNLAALREKEQSLQGLESRIQDLQTQKTALETEIGKSRAEAEGLSKSNEKLSTANERLDAHLQDLRSEVESRERTIRVLKSDTESEKQKHEEMVREVRLFPSEITGYVKEGDRNIAWYTFLSLPFVITLITVTFSLFSNAIDLTQIWREEENINVWTIFLTRLPFVLIALAIVEACGYIVGRFIYEVVRINRQRLEFSKLGILAKDVSAASAKGTDLSDDELFEKETKLKMELLREHMKSVSTSDFEYKGSGIVSALISVANRLSGKADTD